MKSIPSIHARSWTLGPFPKEVSLSEKSLSQYQLPTKDKSLEVATQRELRKKNLYFACKNTWEPNYYCMDKVKIHYIEVVSDEEEDSNIVLDL